MEEDDLLDQFLAVADSLNDFDETKDEKTSTQLKQIKKKEITKYNEDELFLESIDEFCKSLEPSTSGSNKVKSLSEIVEEKKLSLLHSGDTDSSDDESNRDYENSKYNNYGKEIKHLLTSQAPNTSLGGSQTTWKPKRPVATQSTTKSVFVQKTEDFTVITDPFFGIRISNPLISSTVLKERMVNRHAVSMSQLKQFVKRENNNQDWVIAGVIVSKTPVKTSQKGNQYLIWTLSDLKNDLKTCSMFLFGNAFKQLWKTAAGTVLGVLNPSVMEQREGTKDEASLSVDNAQKVMIFGHSKDFGTCKSKKKDGQQCTAFVNKNQTEYCIYHIKTEYQKLSRRSELQANFVGGGLTALRNKVLGKNEVFYAGKSYMAIPAKKNQKMVQKDNDRLKSLSSSKNGILSQIRTGLSTETVAPKIKSAATFDVSKSQRIKDLQLLQKLKGEKGIQEKNSKALEDFEKATFEAQKIQANIENLEKKLELKDSLKEFDFLNDPKSRGTKSTEELLKEENYSTPRKGKKNINDLPRTPNSTKKQFERIENELQDMFNSPKNKMKAAKNQCEASQLEERTKIERQDLSKTATSAKSNSKEENASNNPSTLKNESRAEITHQKTNSKEGQEFDSPSSSKRIQETPKFEKRDPLKTPTSTTKQKSHSKKFDSPSYSKHSQETSKFEKKDPLKTPKSSSIQKSHFDFNSENSIKPSPKGNEKNVPFDNGVKIEKTPKSINLRDATNFQSESSLLKNSSLDTEELNELATKSKFFSKLGTPKLSNMGSKIDLSAPLEKNGSLIFNKAKLNALRFVQKKGPIKKEGEESKKQGVKRFLETIDDFREKRPKLADESFTSQRFKNIMALQSKHTDLLNTEDLEREEKYFRKLEVKEQMEEKMATLFKVDCKAVKCLTCKYEAFSAADKCKEERHVLKVTDAVKRFFKCAKCGNRTVSLKIIPLISCTNCGGSKWDRTTMMKEKVVQIGEKLSIRGLEEKYIGHSNTGGNINLLIPDE